MKNRHFCILYLNKAKYVFVTNEDNSVKLFNSIDEAKSKIDNIRKENTHPLCLNHHVTIYEYEGSTIVGVGTKY